MQVYEFESSDRNAPVLNLGQEEPAIGKTHMARAQEFQQTLVARLNNIAI